VRSASGQWLKQSELIPVSVAWYDKEYFYRVVLGVSDTVHEGIKWQITDHGNNNFVFLNHENKQVRFLITFARENI